MRSAIPRTPDITAIAESHLAALKALIDRYADQSVPYLSRLHPIARRVGDYDRLARVSEWSASGGDADESGDVET